MRNDTSSARLTRRGFTSIALAASAAFALPLPAHALNVDEARGLIDKLVFHRGPGSDDCRDRGPQINELSEVDLGLNDAGDRAVHHGELRHDL